MKTKAKYLNPEPPTKEGEKEESTPDIIKFLLGEAEFNGFWFGDRNEKNHPFWWRGYLRGHISKLQEEVNTLRATQNKND